MQQELISLVATRPGGELTMGHDDASLIYMLKAHSSLGDHL